MRGCGSAVGGSLRDYSRRAHLAGKWCAPSCGVETAGGGCPVCTDADTMAALIISGLAADPNTC